MSQQHYSFHMHLSKKQQKNLLDYVVGAAAYIYPLTALPQLVVVLNGGIEGVSVLSWLGFLLFSLLFFTYGVVHRIKPMIITNMIWAGVDAMIVAGTIMHRMM